MDVTVAVLCDAATDYQGKLNLLGAFDAILARELPLVHPQCSVALRFVFERAEQGGHRMQLKLSDEDGQEVAPPAEFQATCQFPPDDPRQFISQNLILNLQRLRFEKAGRYSFDLSVNGKHEARIPLSIVHQPAPAGGDGSGPSGGEPSGGGPSTGGGQPDKPDNPYPFRDPESEN